jgi:hypothetical protein
MADGHAVRNELTKAIEQRNLPKQLNKGIDQSN